MGARIHEGLIAGASGLTPIYAIFEGGGAKGITHIGALKALEDQRLTPIGVAGTSAGAIIAALVAVGYSPDELFAPDASKHLLSVRKKTPVDLLGRTIWGRFRAIRTWSPLLCVIVAAGSVGSHWALGGLGLLCAFAAYEIFYMAERGPQRVAAATAVPLLWWLIILLWGPAPANLLAMRAAVMAFLALVILLLPVLWFRGLFNPDRVKDELNAILRDKLIERAGAVEGLASDIGDVVRFRHLEQVPGYVPLKIIVTNARTGRLRLFDEHDRDVAIADAVAASAAIPFFFRPSTIADAKDEAGAVFVDGGLISNLPSWAFREEKRAWERRSEGPPVPIIAFTLSEEKAKGADKRRLNLLTYIGRVLAAGLFGSQKVLQDFVSDLIVVDLPSPLRTLAFNCTRAQARQAYEAGRREAGRQLNCDQLFTTVTGEALKAFGQDVRKLIMLRRKRSARDNPPRALRRYLAALSGQRRRHLAQPVPRLRFNVIDPVERRAYPQGTPWRIAYRVVAGVGMDDDADDRLELDPDNDAAPRACDKNIVIYRPLKGRKARTLVMTKYEHALISKSVDSVLCIPISSGQSSEPAERVLCIDSEDSLEGEYADEDFIRKVKDRAALLSSSLLEASMRENGHGDEAL